MKDLDKTETILYKVINLTCLYLTVLFLLTIFGITGIVLLVVSLVYVIGLIVSCAIQLNKIDDIRFNQDD